MVGILEKFKIIIIIINIGKIETRYRCFKW